MADPTGAPFDPFAAQREANKAQQLAQMLQQSQTPMMPPTQTAGRFVVPFSPIAGLAHAGDDLLTAWAQKKATDKQSALDQGRAKIYADALQEKPQDEVNISPQVTQPGQNANFNYGGPTQPNSQDMIQAIMNGGDPKMIGPALAEALKSNMDRDAKANEPITPYQKAQLANVDDQRQYERHQADFAQLDKGSDEIQKALDSGVSVNKVLGTNAAAAMKAGDVANAELPAKLAAEKAKADAAAANQPDFGRGMQGRAYEILKRGLNDPAYRATPEYITAWQIASNPQVNPNTGTIVTPDLSAFAPPTGGQSAPGPGQPPQAAPSGAPGAPPAQRMPSVQSFAPPNPSQAEAGSAGYANRLSESSGIIDKNQDSGTSLYNRTMSAVPGGNYAVGSGYQQLDQAERNFVNAQLRRESGAAISESEFQNARKQYFPQPGDKPEVLAQKKKARDMAVQNMQLSAGNVLLPPGVVQQSSPPKGAPMVPQQQGFGAQAPAAGGGWKIERVQ